MNSEQAFRRRKRTAALRTVRDSPTAPLRRAGDRSRGVAAREALDVARYVADMTAQLEAMAIAADLDLLAYFMGMAKAEAELFIRTNAEASEEPESSGDQGVADHEAESGKPVD